jgi:hypothetical protein
VDLVHHRLHPSTPSRPHGLRQPEQIEIEPATAIEDFVDEFGKFARPTKSAADVPGRLRTTPRSPSETGSAARRCRRESRSPTGARWRQDEHRPTGRGCLALAGTRWRDAGSRGRRLAARASAGLCCRTPRRPGIPRDCLLGPIDGAAGWPHSHETASKLVPRRISGCSRRSGLPLASQPCSPQAVRHVVTDTFLKSSRAPRRRNFWMAPALRLDQKLTGTE